MTNDADDPADGLPMPEDPDWTAVPHQCRHLDGKTIWVYDADTGTWTTANPAILPGAWGDLRRRRDGFYDDTDNGGTTP